VQTRELQQILQQLLQDSKDKASPARSSSNLTILRFAFNDKTGQEPLSFTADFNQLLQVRRYRILEADDLEQAELLARVWKPDVLLLEGGWHDPLSHLRQLSYHTGLASLPIVTVDQETTQAANHIPGLMVFPCLATSDTNAGRAGNAGIPDTAALLQVIQIAAGCGWRPSILAVDVATLPFTAGTRANSPQMAPGPGDFLKETEWLQALIQYLQTAGFRGAIAPSWQEVLQQMQSHSVDLLLLCWTDSAPPSVMELLAELGNLDAKPPILVLDHRTYDEQDRTNRAPIPALLNQIATQILGPSVSMTDLMGHIHQVMEEHPR
jgi:DNA-binding response OmpR family regulator